jgi:hypothetical protein
MSITAKVIEKSITPVGKVITTFQLRYPRFIHAEFMTHRVFSRNASSSRAIPVQKMLDQIMAETAAPIHWGANQPGMQAHAEMADFERGQVQVLWSEAAQSACRIAQYMHDLGAHKQIVNRITEPFQHISVICTATEWSNFYELRNHPDAQPEIHELAARMLEADQNFVPILRTPRFDDKDDAQVLVLQDSASWHLPYVTETERLAFPKSARFLAKLSAARCARVSYLTHDGETPLHEKDLALFDRLVGSKPLHASPIEHQAIGAPFAEMPSNNFKGWVQFRWIYEQGPMVTFAD